MSFQNDIDVITVLVGDALTMLKTLPSDSIDCCVTSPPYWAQRDYDHPAQIGLEPLVGLYVERLAEVFTEVRRVLTPRGTLWLNIGDSYASNWGMGAVGRKAAWWSTRSGELEGKGWGDVQTAIRANSFGAKQADGLKAKDLVGVPWRLALRLQADGWFLRSDIVWDKPNAREIVVRDRPMNAHEHLFLLAREQSYHYDGAALSETLGRRARNVWSIPIKAYKGAHFATFPPDLIRPCIAAGCPPGGLVLDPFAGAGTTGIVAREMGRRALLIEINESYADLIRQRVAEESA